MWMISEVESETELVSFRLQAQLLNCRHTSSFGPLVTCSPVSFFFSLSHFGQQTLHCITPYSLKQFFRSRPSSKCVWPPKKVATSVWSGVWPSDWPPLFIFSQSPSSSPPTLLSPSVHCPLAESHHLLSIWHPFLSYSFFIAAWSAFLLSTRTHHQQHLWALTRGPVKWKHLTPTMTSNRRVHCLCLWRVVHCSHCQKKVIQTNTLRQRNIKRMFIHFIHHRQDTLSPDMSTQKRHS